MKLAAFRHLLAGLLALSPAWTAAPVRAFSLDMPRSGRASVICTPESTGEWDGHISRGGKQVHERCDTVLRCVEGNLTRQIERCNGKGNCTPLVVHRQLARLGCGFEPDEFWLPANAKLDSIEHQSGARSATLRWDSKTCKAGTLDAIQDALNALIERGSSEGRWIAIQTLLSHGCNVDVSKLDVAGGFEHVDLQRNEDVVAGASGIVPQPPVTVTFTPLRPPDSTSPTPPKSGEASGASAPPPTHQPPDTDSCDPEQVQMCVPATIPVTDGDVPICTALQQLSDARQFARCESRAHDHGVRVQVAGPGDSQHPYERNLRIVAPKECENPQNCAEPPVTTPDGADGTKCDPSICPVPKGNEQPPPSPVLSAGAAAGSIGLGAVLAALVKWLLGLLKKKQKPDGALASTLASHEAHDVQVIIASFDRRDQPVRSRMRM